MESLGYVLYTTALSITFILLGFYFLKKISKIDGENDEIIIPVYMITASILIFSGFVWLVQNLINLGKVIF